MSLAQILSRNVLFSVPMLRFPVAVKLLWRHRRRIEGAYTGRVAFLLASSALASILSVADRIAYPKPQQARIWDKPVVFILGYWRSGTTFLHELMATDPQFRSPTLLEANAAPCMVAGQSFAKIVQRLLPKTRGFDPMPLDLDAAWEEEGMLFSLNGESPFLGSMFPNDYGDFDHLLDLRHLSGQAEQSWQRCYVAICQRLAEDRIMLFKSPSASARLPLLLRTFPRARFIHIHRDKADVYQSNMRMMREFGQGVQMQKAKPDSLSDYILHRYEVIYDRYEHDVDSLPPGRLVHVDYDELVERPIDVLRQAYRDLALGGFEEAQPAMQQYLSCRQGYQARRYAPLPDEIRTEIDGRWERFRF